MADIEKLSKKQAKAVDKHENFISEMIKNNNERKDGLEESISEAKKALGSASQALIEIWKNESAEAANRIAKNNEHLSGIKDNIEKEEKMAPLNKKEAKYLKKLSSVHHKMLDALGAEGSALKLVKDAIDAQANENKELIAKLRAGSSEKSEQALYRRAQEILESVVGPFEKREAGLNALVKSKSNVIAKMEAEINSIDKNNKIYEERLGAFYKSIKRDESKEQAQQGSASAKGEQKKQA